MATQTGRKGCGSCGCVLALFVFLLTLVLVGVGFSYFYAANNLTRTATTGRVLLPATAFNRQTYTTARQKFDQFFADPAERSLTLSNAEVNALLAESPELRLFHRGIVVAFDHISAQVYSSVPLDLPFLPRRYLNCSFETRPSDARRRIGAGRFAVRAGWQTYGSSRGPPVPNGDPAADRKVPVDHEQDARVIERCANFGLKTATLSWDDRVARETYRRRGKRIGVSAYRRMGVRRTSLVTAVSQRAPTAPTRPYADTFPLRRYVSPLSPRYSFEQVDRPAVVRLPILHEKFLSLLFCPVLELRAVPAKLVQRHAVPTGVGDSG